MACEKKTYTAAREISENWEMRKKFIWQMACEKKYIHGPAVGILLDLRKKNIHGLPVGITVKDRGMPPMRHRALFGLWAVRYSDLE